MNILIISLPRTGSTALGKKLSIDNNLFYNFEPFNPLNKIDTTNKLKNAVVKTIIFHKPNYISENKRVEWLISLTDNFDKTILLSRKDLISCAESWAYLNNKKLSLTSTSQYFWEKTPNYERAYSDIQKWNIELEHISKTLSIPITYYEEIFNINSEDRLRRGNRGDLEKKII